MTTIDTTRTETRHTPAQSGITGIPFGRLVRVEWRKLIDTTSGKWLLVAIAGLAAFALAITWFTADFRNRPTDVPPEMAIPLPFEAFASSTVGPVSFLLPVIGILAITTEWSQRTGLATFTLEPRRARVTLAKIIAALGIAVVSAAIALGLAAIVNQAAIMADKHDDGFKMASGLIAGLVVALMLSMAQGLAFGMLIPNTAAAIVTYFILPQLFSIVMMWDKLASARPWLDMSQAMSPLFNKGISSLTSEEWQHLGSSTALWVLLPLLIGLVIQQRREVK